MMAKQGALRTAFKFRKLEHSGIDLFKLSQPFIQNLKHANQDPSELYIGVAQSLSRV